jgi:hypothetical protein
MSFDVEEYPELQNDIFDRYDCNDVENMSLQEFTEIVQYDYHNIAFDFSRELCRPKWEDCQDRRREYEEEDEFDETDEIEETIEQAEQDIERKEQEIEDLEEQIRLGMLSLEAEPISKPKRKRKGIIQKVVGFFRGLFR